MNIVAEGLRPNEGLDGFVEEPAYQSRRECRLACHHSCKSGKQIERCLISTFKVAESIGFKGEFRQWEELLRIGD